MKITRTKSVKASTSTNRKIDAARVGKTKEVIVLQSNYGYGWDDIMEYEVTQSREAKDDLKTYRENERNASHRLIRRRIPNPDWVAPADRFSVIQYDGGFRYKMGKPVKFSDIEEAIAHATDLWKHSGFEVVLKDAVTGCNIQLIPLEEYRTEKNLRIFRETVGSDEDVKSATSTRKKSVKANTGAKRRYVSASADDEDGEFTESVGINDEFVFFFDGKELYRGDESAEFFNVIADLCRDEDTNIKFQEWCNQYGDPFEFDGTPEDTADAFTSLVHFELMESEDFYLDGNGILSFEMFYASDVVESSENVTASIGRPNQEDDMDYYEQLAQGAVGEYNSYWNASATYEISDSAITFMENGNVIYVQPLQNITPNWDDLSGDIAELGDALIGEMLPF